MNFKNKRNIIVSVKTVALLIPIILTDLVLDEVLNKPSNLLFQNYCFQAYGSNLNQEDLTKKTSVSFKNASQINYENVEVNIQSIKKYEKSVQPEKTLTTLLDKAPVRTVVNGADYASLDVDTTNKSISYLSFNGKITAAVDGYHDAFDRTGVKGEFIGHFTATAYDTSHNEDVTATSIVVSSRSLEDIRIIAVDPTVIPLMSKVYLEFPEPYEYLNGIYMAADTGSKIKQNVIDIFWGDFGNSSPQSLWDFGRRNGIKIYTVK